MPLDTVTAPEGSHFEFETVKTKGGTKDLGPVPMLVWDDLDAAIAHYTAEGIKGVLDGTSLRVSFQGIARRLRIQGKSDDDIAKTQLDFKPGTREVGTPTPASRAAKAAKTAVDKLGGSDSVTRFLERVAAGDISEEELANLAGISQ